MKMNSKTNGEYTEWHERFIQCYKDNNPAGDLLDKMIRLHPGINVDKCTQSQKESIKRRIENYCRPSKKTNIRSKYARSPHLDDLYALCTAKNITPNEILLTEKKDICKYSDIVNRLKQTVAGSTLFNHFDITEDDFPRDIALADDLAFLSVFPQILSDHFDEYFKVDDKDFSANSYGHVTFHVPSSDDDLEFWLRSILKYVVDMQNNSNQASTTLKFLSVNRCLSFIKFTGSHFIYYFSTRQFDMFDYSNYNQWSPKMQCVAAIHVYIYICVVLALMKTGALKGIGKNDLRIRKLQNLYFSINPSIYDFIVSSLSNAFNAINQNGIISFSGYLHTTQDSQGIRERRTEIRKERDISTSSHTLNDALSKAFSHDAAKSSRDLEL